VRLSGLLDLRRSGQAKRVAVSCAAQWVTHSTCLNDQLEVKMQRIVTVRPMSLMGQNYDVAASPRHFRSSRKRAPADAIGTSVEAIKGSGPVSLNHLVDEREQIWRQFKANRFRGLQVDHKQIFAPQPLRLTNFRHKHV
jgi:hypothetical protein